MIARKVIGVLAALAVTVAAQHDPEPVPTNTGSSGGSRTTSASSGPATHTIAVGANGHVFTPNNATAEVGDIIKFTFYPAGDNPHRVARAEFGWPCIPYEYANLNKPGFYTGIFAPQVISNDPPSYTVRVNDTEPIFFYCAAPHSCVDYHMIGVINPNATQSLARQLEYAEDATYQLMPGEPFPSETPVPTPTPGGPPPGEGGDDDGGGGGGLSGGAIAGIAIGAAAVLILAAALVYLCGRRGGFDKAYRKSALPAAGAAAVTGGGAAAPGSPGMVEANYANAAGVGVGVGAAGVAAAGHNPKSPGQGTVSTYDGRNSLYAGAGGYPPYAGTTPSPGPPGAGPAPAYGFAPAGQHGHEGYAGGMYPSPHSSPRADQYTPFLQPQAQAPVELPTGDAPVPTQSPPPGYHQGRES
ncbi:extracellular serine-rich protein [Chaetomium fimeti]|uniref:Extracellular serine-rich protein n=1 Tax=Chaetomium fimeti TaxID=1854472 RepID=A0AAE0HPI9_9PEZI|nr:extracellular serine-rich protein [Chaetomium fimeti]